MKFKKTIIASVAALALTGFITGCSDEKKNSGSRSERQQGGHSQSGRIPRPPR